MHWMHNEIEKEAQSDFEHSVLLLKITDIASSSRDHILQNKTLKYCKKSQLKVKFASFFW